MVSLKSRDECLTEANPSVSKEEEVTTKSTSVCSKTSLQMTSRPTDRDIAFRCQMTPPFPQPNFLNNYPERHLSIKHSPSVLRKSMRSESHHLSISTGP